MGLRVPVIELLLLRHAKSSWDDERLADRERPLSKRGKTAASAMGRYMSDMGLVPDVVFCSPARRARDTWDLVSKELHGAGRTEVVDAVYDFGDGTRLLELIKAKGGSSRCLLLVGHNPSLENLALRLIGSGDEELRSRLGAKFPTCALAALRFESGDWAAIAEGGGRLEAFVRPRDFRPPDDV